MNRFQKLLVFVPVFIAYLVCDKTWTDFVAMMIGGLVLWIPYWLAWWLSDGFNIFNAPCSFDDEDLNWLSDECYGYKSGPEGYGYYVGDQCIHR